MTSDPKTVLQEIFGHHSFRGRQEEVITRVMAGGDAVALFPTGAGKSVCFQIPAICRPGTGLVVSPLIALMQDQVEALTAKGVAAAAINSSLSPKAVENIMSRVDAGELKLLYVTPERVMRKDFQRRLSRAVLSVIAIDEAHCASQWGHDFRPEYAELGKLATIFPGVPRIALTATADPVTKTDMLHLLRMEAAPVYATGFDRPNISYAIQKKANPREQLLEFVSQRRGASGIVYCLSRKKTLEITAWLTTAGIPAAAYHGGMDQSERDHNQAMFMKGEVDILVGTTAFGMGIDKKDVRFVAHVDWPSSIEAYFQETGRAGRDGEPAEAWMIYGLDDLARRRMMIQKNRSIVARRVEHDKLSALVGVVETHGCRRRALLSHFGQPMAADCGNCDNCRNPKQIKDGGIEALALLEHAEAGGLAIHDLVERASAASNNSNQAEMHSILRQMIAQGMLAVDHSRLSSVVLTETGKKALDERNVMIAADGIATPSAAPRRPAVRKPKTQPSGPKPQRPRLGPDQELYMALRRLRSKIARKARTQPFKVFTDATLQEMASQRPTTRIDFIGVPGVGPTKLDRWGEDFMEIIREHAPRYLNDGIEDIWSENIDILDETENSR